MARSLQPGGTPGGQAEAALLELPQQRGKEVTPMAAKKKAKKGGAKKAKKK